MNGHSSISRTTKSQGSDSIRFRMEDDTSGVTFLEVEMSLEDFARILTGQGHIPCTFELYAQNVGKTRETKTEIVPLENRYFATDKERQEALKPFEVDGWEARQGDISNHHNYTNSDGVKVVFMRFI